MDLVIKKSSWNIFILKKGQGDFLKRFFTFLLCGVTSVFAAGCGNKPGDLPKELVTTFESQAEIKTKGTPNEKEKKYKCKVFHSAENINNITFLEPKSFSGLTFIWENGKYEIAMDGLSGEFTMETLPDSAFLLFIVDALNSANNKENLKYDSKDGENVIYKAVSDSGDYKIHVASNGNIVRLVMEDRGIEVEFDIK